MVSIMLEFKTWFNQDDVNDDEINRAYDKAHFAVDIVRLYDQTLPKDRKLLQNISTIANLTSGAYGLYNSGENKNIIPPNLQSAVRLKFGPAMLQNKLQDVPRKVLKDQLQANGVHFNPNDIKPSDVIRINVSRILREFGDSLETILQLASTIIHEATHELEKEKTGTTSEAGPQMAERQFMLWAKNNMENIFRKIPELRSIGQASFRPQGMIQTKLPQNNLSVRPGGTQL